jgi:hypothetical protein
VQLAGRPPAGRARSLKSRPNTLEDDVGAGLSWRRGERHDEAHVLLEVSRSKLHSQDFFRTVPTRGRVDVGEVRRVACRRYVDHGANNDSLVDAGRLYMLRFLWTHAPMRLSLTETAIVWSHWFQTGRHET